MKCTNCGGDFQTADLRCPYCGTDNAIGLEWENERKWYKRLYLKTKKEFYMYGIWHTLNKILNRAMLILGAVIALVVGIMVVAFSIESDVSNFNKKIHLKENAQKMAEYHENGQWLELYDLMNEYDLFNPKEHYVYGQAALIANDYEEYMMHKIGFFCLSEEEKLEDDYHLYYAIRDSWEVYKVDCGVYDELAPENVAWHETYKEEILCYWKYGLGMTDEEISGLIELDYITSDEMNTLMNNIKERKGWQ